MAGRWPRAQSPSTLWNYVREDKECISHFREDELEIANAGETSRSPRYVKSRSVVEEADRFDAEFFGILPTEAERIDPQHRLFLECCWEAFESAAYDPERVSGAVGVIAGCAINSYFLRQICTNPLAIEEFTTNYPLGHYATLLGTISDTLATRVAYKLNLRGPCYTLQSACSTSLVAIAQFIFTDVERFRSDVGHERCSNSSLAQIGAQVDQWTLELCAPIEFVRHISPQNE